MTDSTYTPKIDPRSPWALNLALDLEALGGLIGEVNVANGWDVSRQMVAKPQEWSDRHITTHKIAELGLITTEVAEAIEEVRHGHGMSETYYTTVGLVYPGGNGPLVHKPEGVPSELADVIIRVLDLANAYGIDIGAAVIEKLNHNATRGLHHGGKAL